MCKDETKHGTLEYNEKAPPAPESKSPVNDTKDMTLARFRALSTFDKLWVLTQALALLCCFLVAVGGGCAYFTSDLVNCDGNSPYSQALFSGLQATLLCINGWLYAYHLRRAGKDLNSPDTLSLQARRRRRQRIPLLLAFVAVGQYLAAVAVGLVAHRTSRAPLGLGFVCIVASVGP